MDPETGRIVEKENILPTPETLRTMSDPEWMAEHLKDDLALRLYAFKLGYIRDLDRGPSDRLAATVEGVGSERRLDDLCRVHAAL